MGVLGIESIQCLCDGLKPAIIDELDFRVKNVAFGSLKGGAKMKQHFQLNNEGGQETIGGSMRKCRESELLDPGKINSGSKRIRGESLHPSQVQGLFPSQNRFCEAQE